MVCPQCRKVSEFHTTNYGLMSALDSLSSLVNGNNKEVVVQSCMHIDFVPSNNLDCCGHCNKRFCTPCLLAHKVFLRQEAAMIASNVRHYISHNSRLKFSPNA